MKEIKTINKELDATNEELENIIIELVEREEYGCTANGCGANGSICGANWS